MDSSTDDVVFIRHRPGKGKAWVIDRPFPLIKQEPVDSNIPESVQINLTAKEGLHSTISSQRINALVSAGLATLILNPNNLATSKPPMDRGRG